MVTERNSISGMHRSIAEIGTVYVFDTLHHCKHLQSHNWTHAWAQNAFGVTATYLDLQEGQMTVDNYNSNYAAISQQLPL